MSNSPVCAGGALALRRTRAARNAPAAKVCARRRAMRDFDALAVAGETRPCARRRRRRRAAVAKPIVPGVRSPVTPSRAYTARSAERRVHAGRRRFAEPQRRSRRRVDLVPMMHLDDLDVVRGTERRAAGSTSVSSTLTPTLMLAANTMGIVRGHARPALPSARRSRPVVPTTAPRDDAHRLRRCASVPSGRVKSTRTSPAPGPRQRRDRRSTPAMRPLPRAGVRPSAVLSATSSAAASVRADCASVARISAWPIRPPAPAIATRIGRMRQGVAAAAGSASFLKKSRILPINPASWP